MECIHSIFSGTVILLNEIGVTYALAVLHFQDLVTTQVTEFGGLSSY